MNLYDIVRREDRCLEVLSGSVEGIRLDKPDWFVGVKLAPHAHLRLRHADEFSFLETFPRDFGWTIEPLCRVAEGRRIDEPSPTIDVVLRADEGQQSSRISSIGKDGSILITWPNWAGKVSHFDIEIINKNSIPILIKAGLVFDPRAELRSLLKGVGAEVGPGANPCVRADVSTDILYVETAPIEDWYHNYGKKTDVSEEIKELWSRYVIGDAQQLECCSDASLDFIFSNHVFEHLMNPLGVLTNWSRKLKATGLVAGVVPDLRFCFDLRQQPSTPKDWLTEHANNQWALTPEKYERWCRHTAPYQEPQDLIKRKYSIHAHYYTPASFRQLAELAIAEGIFSRLFLNTSPNNKDFGWVLWKE